MVARLLSIVVLVFITSTSAMAETLESQSNPVAQGTITVAEGDTDRSDWDGIPWYEFDDDFLAFYPVDIDRVQIAHDATHVYFHITALEWDSVDAWRIGTYIDSDTDLTTGYTGGFLPLGVDFLIEDAAAYRFVAPSQVDWGWEEAVVGDRDRSSAVDVELAIPRAKLGNPTAFDFILNANNSDQFGNADDIYPNELGFVLTYVLGEVVTVPGDFNTDGVLDVVDIDLLTADIATMSNTAAWDLTNDGTTTIADIDSWLALKGTLNGDADLSGDVAFSDFLIVANSFSMAASWSSGDFDGNGRVEFGDFLILSNNFGKSGVAVASVPEPNTNLSLCIGSLLLLAVHRRQLAACPVARLNS